MSNRKLWLCVAVLMSIGFIELHAQSMLNVKENSGSNSSFYINNLRKVSFSEGNMVVEKTDKTLSSYSISGIRKLDFKGISTDIQIPQQILKVENRIILYPNPVRDLLYFQNHLDEKCIISVEVLDLQGKVLLKETISSINSINVSALHKGMYICRVNTCDKIENIKFLKQ